MMQNPAMMQHPAMMQNSPLAFSQNTLRVGQSPSMSSADIFGYLDSLPDRQNCTAVAPANRTLTPTQNIRENVLERTQRAASIPPQRPKHQSRFPTAPPGTRQLPPPPVDDSDDDESMNIETCTPTVVEEDDCFIIETCTPTMLNTTAQNSLHPFSQASSSLHPFPQPSSEHVSASDSQPPPPPPADYARESVTQYMMPFTYPAMDSNALFEMNLVSSVSAAIHSQNRIPLMKRFGY